MDGTDGGAAAPILLVGHVDPWADPFGARLRLRLTYAALAAFAPVDVVVVTNDPPPDPAWPPSPAPRRVLRLTPPPTRLRAAARMRWALRPHTPLELLGRDHDELRRHLATWVDERYSLTWVTRSRTLAAVLPVLPSAPVILDLDDLESSKLRTRLQVGTTAERAPDLGPARRWALHAQALRNVAAWRHFDRQQADLADVAVVCSDTDAKELDGTGPVRVVPNAYAIPAQPVGKATTGWPPTILLHGLMTYAPNADAAQYFVDDILPVLRRHVPDVALRIVGRHDAAVASLHDPPGITVTGFVDEIESELRRADVVAVPIRFGGGTRIKVLEAMAHRIPVVSTTVGAHGLGLRDDVHALLRDDADGFAQACQAVLTNAELRARLVESAAAHVRERFTDDAAIGQIQRIATEAAPTLGTPHAGGTPHAPDQATTGP